MLPLTTGSNIITRIGRILLSLAKAPVRHFRIITMWNFSKKSPVLLFMQHLDSTLQLKLGRFGLKSKLQTGAAPKANNKKAFELASSYAKIVDGEPYLTLTESLLGIPTTAHILGGAVMGESRDLGVIDSENRVYGYPNMLVCDGSMISANPGVNPSLTITAIAEHAMSKIPHKGH